MCLRWLHRPYNSLLCWVKGFLSLFFFCFLSGGGDLSKVKDWMVWVSLLDQKVSWLILFCGHWDKLGQFNWSLLLLCEMYVVSINNDVLSKVGFTSKTVVMWNWWLVDWPVVEWWVDNWVLGIGLDKIIVNSINDNFSLSKILISSHTMLMWWWWLVDWPVIIWWVYNWVLKLN